MIAAENINFKYPENGGFKLKDVNLSLEPGSFAALIGPNGAGKTTLIKIMAGLIGGYGGRVILDSKDIRNYSARIFAGKVSYIPQGDGGIFDFSLFDIVAMGRRPYINEAGMLKKTDTEAIDAALDAFGLFPKKHRKYGSLSGGERRMALIARAMAQEADILLMDEPTTYLDMQHGSELMEKLLQLNGAGRTVLMISHDLNLAAEFIRRVVFIKEGGIVFDGPAGEGVREDRIKELYGIENFTIQENRKTGKKNVFLMPKINL
jgi:iron complex transport system ATP-binding protein